MNYENLLWAALVGYGVLCYRRHRRLARMERACRLMKHVAQRFEQQQQQERE